MTIQGIRVGPLSNIILTMKARRFLRKGCEAFLALVLDSKQGQVNWKYSGGKIIFGRVFRRATRSST